MKEDEVLAAIEGVGAAKAAAAVGKTAKTTTRKGR
jgi:hypothetical protein